MKLPPHRFVSALFVATLSWAIGSLHALEAVDLETSGGQHEYVQNFNSLPVDGEAEWENGVTLPGWHVVFTAKDGELTGIRAVSGQGAVTSTAVQSFGADGSENRALGFVASPVAPRTAREPGLGTMAAGLILHNPGSNGIVIESVAFTASQWRVSQSPNATDLEVGYRVTAAPEVFTVSGGKGFNDLKELKWTTPKVQSPRPAGVDGRSEDASARLEVSDEIILPSGEYLTIRWSATAATRHGVGIDDVTIRYRVK
jgi:hypothetical protein